MLQEHRKKNNQILFMIITLIHIKMYFHMPTNIQHAFTLGISSGNTLKVSSLLQTQMVITIEYNVLKLMYVYKIFTITLHNSLFMNICLY